MLKNSVLHVVLRCPTSENPKTLLPPVPQQQWRCVAAACGGTGFGLEGGVCFGLATYTLVEVPRPNKCDRGFGLWKRGQLRDHFATEPGLPYGELPKCFIHLGLSRLSPARNDSALNGIDSSSMGRQIGILRQTGKAPESSEKSRGRIAMQVYPQLREPHLCCPVARVFPF